MKTTRVWLGVACGVLGAGWGVLGAGCDGGLRVEAGPLLPVERTVGAGGANGGGGAASEVGDSAGDGGAGGGGGDGGGAGAHGSSASDTALRCDRHTATPLDAGRVLLVGRCSVGDEDEEMDGALVYDLATRAFTRVPMAEPRALHAAGALADGRVAIVGDGAHVEVFDPAAGAFALGPALHAARTEPAVSVGPDGRLWVVGGYDEEGGALASSEIVDLAAGTSSPGPTLLEPRAGAAAFSLADGSVIVVGGEAPAQCGFSPWPLMIERSNYGMCPFHAIGDDPLGAGSVAVAAGVDGTTLVTTYASAAWDEAAPLVWRDHDATTLFPSVTVTETGRVLAAGVGVYEGVTHVVEITPGAAGTLVGARPSNGAYATITRLVGDTVLVVGPDAALFTP